MESLQYPIGRFESETELSEQNRSNAIKRLERFPSELKALCEKFTPADWSNSYRPQGWTAAQVVNHLADSHLHSYARFKHAITEDTPTIKDYPEPLWAALLEAQSIESIPGSLMMIEGIHHRWVGFLKALYSEDFSRCFFHPETQTQHSLHQALAYYSWHCDHHLGHLKIIKNMA